MLLLLQANRRLTAAELADRLEVSVRTIYRDLDALTTAGVPVYTERGPKGGVSLLDAYVKYMFNSDWGIKGGQFKEPLTHEKLVSYKRQLLVERGAEVI